MDEICVAKFDVYECRKSDRASALSAAQTPEFPDTIPTIPESLRSLADDICVDRAQRF